MHQYITLSQIILVLFQGKIVLFLLYLLLSYCSYHSVDSVNPREQIKKCTPYACNMLKLRTVDM